MYRDSKFSSQKAVTSCMLQSYKSNNFIVQLSNFGIIFLQLSSLSSLIYKNLIKSKLFKSLLLQIARVLSLVWYIQSMTLSYSDITGSSFWSTRLLAFSEFFYSELSCFELGFIVLEVEYNLYSDILSQNLYFNSDYQVNNLKNLKLVLSNQNNVLVLLST
ncbi:Hypothetical_protein [Hexamita inflata]|uniref:Hypothetical_protein n=1 Tax=Hexamita inflata TaxID=28002 RepID=A0ABP1JV76_9EUKA